MIAKKNKCKRIRDNIYFVYNEFLIIFQVRIYKMDDQLNMVVAVKIKPYDFDNFLWDVLNMSSNKNESNSLRVIGAFTFRPLGIFEEKVACLENQTSIDETLEKLVGESFVKVKKLIDEEIQTASDFCIYTEKLGEGWCDTKLAYMLNNIMNKNFEEAIRIAQKSIENGERGYMRIGDEDVYQRVIRYSEEMIKR